MMKNLYLSDALYLEDFDSILYRLFNETPLNMQPRYLVEVDCGDGYLLKRAFEYIKTKTLRGLKLAEYPLEVVPLIVNAGAVESVRRKIADIPHRIAMIDDTVLAVLQIVGIQDMRSCIVLDAFTDGKGLIEECYGVIHLQAHADPSDFLLNMGMKGWFAQAGASFKYPSVLPKFTLNYFEKRPWSVRNAILEDLPKLLQLEEACWPTEQRMSENTIKERIQKYPQGHFVLELDKEVVGVIYSQRICDSYALNHMQADGVDALHNDLGGLAHILALNISPEKQKMKLGGHLLEFALQSLSLNPKIDSIVGVTRCMSYSGAKMCSMASFIEEKTEDGQLVDPVLRMHAQHGGIITGLIANYRPKDRENQGYGVLVTYPVNDRVVVVKREVQAEEESKIAKWLYEVEWIKQPGLELAALAYDRIWVIFADPTLKVAHAIRELLMQQRQYCIIVQPGTKFEKLGSESYSVNPHAPEDFEQLFSSLANSSHLSGVIYLWGMDQNLDMNQLEAWHKKICEGMLGIVKALDLLSLSEKVSLWLIVQSIVNDASLEALAQWPLNAICRVISEEYLQFPSCYLAVDPLEDSVQTAKRIYGEIASKEAKAPDGQIAWKGSERFVPRMVRTSLEHTNKPHFSEAASYLVAGGLSVLGLHIVQWYVDHGAKTIIILDETDPTPEKSIKLDELRQKGVNIVLFKAKFDDEQEFKEMFGKIKAELPVLAGIVHTVALLEDELLRHTTWEIFKNMYRLRVTGSWNLHKCTEMLKLDHFVLFSSMISHFSPTGKASQALATSFLEALSYYRKKNNLASLTITWGVWGIKQAIVKHVIETRRLQENLEVLTVEEALDALTEVLYTSKPCITVAKIKWPAVMTQLGTETHFFDAIETK